ncbi:MAG: AmmeMemoRadiSam system radical SAM enzyme [Nanopusillaceae archaeon]
MNEAILYKKNEKYVECLACNRRCKLKDGQIGYCGVRLNLKNKLYLLNWGLFISVAIDPIEKKPLYHFYPGSAALSLGTTGCSFSCMYCLNWDISQRRRVIGIKLEPEEIVELAKENNVRIITFTYNEPSIYSEFTYEVSKIAKKEGIKITWVSNGYLTDEAIDFASKFLDAITVDIKGNGNESFARKYILILNYESVFQAIEELYKKGVHVEITDLVIPEIGDNLKDAKNMCKKIYEIMGEKSNIHFLRFYPEYKMTNLYPTPLKTLEKHVEIAKKEGIMYTYLGNVPGHELENTYCPKCNTPLIKRRGFMVYEINLNGKKCKNCGEEIYIIGDPKKSEIYYPRLLYINKKTLERYVDNNKIVEKELF